MVKQRRAPSFDDRLARSEEFAIADVVVDEAEPGVEQQVERHSTDPAVIHLLCRRGGQVGRDRRLNPNQGGPGVRRQQWTFHDEPGVERLMLRQAFEVPFKHLSHGTPPSAQFVESHRNLPGMATDHRGDQFVTGSEVHKDRSVGHTGAVSDVDGASRCDPLVGHEVERSVDQRGAGLILALAS